MKNISATTKAVKEDTNNTNNEGRYNYNANIFLDRKIEDVTAGLRPESSKILYKISYSSEENAPPLIILITPFGILEVFAYGIALSRSGILVYDLVTKKPWRVGCIDQSSKNALAKQLFNAQIYKQDPS